MGRGRMGWRESVRPVGNSREGMTRSDAARSGKSLWRGRKKGRRRLGATRASRCGKTRDGCRKVGLMKDRSDVRLDSRYGGAGQGTLSGRQDVACRLGWILVRSGVSVGHGGTWIDTIKLQA